MIKIYTDGNYQMGHQMEEVFGFLTLDDNENLHLYVVGEFGNAIDLSDAGHAEYNDFQTVEDLTEYAHEKLIKVFSNFSDLTLVLED